MQPYALNSRPQSPDPKAKVLGVGVRVVGGRMVRRPVVGRRAIRRRPIASRQEHCHGSKFRGLGISEITKGL